MRGRFRSRFGGDYGHVGGAKLPAIVAYRPKGKRSAIAHLSARPKKRLGSRLTKPLAAMVAGWRFALVSPKGHAVSFHKDERTAATAMQVLRGSGCVVRPIESLL